jgi:hypothetical protein
MTFPTRLFMQDARPEHPGGGRLDLTLGSAYWDRYRLRSRRVGLPKGVARRVGVWKELSGYDRWCIPFRRQ